MTKQSSKKKVLILFGWISLGNEKNATFSPAFFLEMPNNFVPKILNRVSTFVRHRKIHFKLVVGVAFLIWTTVCFIFCFRIGTISIESAASIFEFRICLDRTVYVLQKKIAKSTFKFRTNTVLIFIGSIAFGIEQNRDRFFRLDLFGIEASL